MHMYAPRLYGGSGIVGGQVRLSFDWSISCVSLACVLRITCSGDIGDVSCLLFDWLGCLVLMAAWLAQVPVGAGLAFAHKYKKDGSVSVSLYGDGAANQGQVSRMCLRVWYCQLMCLCVCVCPGL